jgi:hypothetical protein
MTSTTPLPTSSSKNDETDESVSERKPLIFIPSDRTDDLLIFDPNIGVVRIFATVTLLNDAVHRVCVCALMFLVHH